MAVPTRITDFNTTAASNAPTGSESVGTSLDDYLRGYQAVVRLDLASKGSDIASAGTTDLGAVGGLAHDITGTTTITGFGTVAAGIPKIIKFEDALTLTHNSTSLILPGGANITTADGDVAIVISEGSGNWRCASYVKANGTPIVDGTAAASETVAGKVELATDAEALAGSDTARAVTSAGLASSKSLAEDGYMKLPGGIILQWGTGTTSSGSVAVTFPTAFASACYSVVSTPSDSTSARYSAATSKTTSGFTAFVWSTGGNPITSTFNWFAVGV